MSKSSFDTDLASLRAEWARLDSIGARLNLPMESYRAAVELHGEAKDPGAERFLQLHSTGDMRVHEHSQRILQERRVELMTTKFRDLVRVHKQERGEALAAEAKSIRVEEKKLSERFGVSASLFGAAAWVQQHADADLAWATEGWKGYRWNNANLESALMEAGIS
jgi:hypothetical protein